MKIKLIIFTAFLTFLSSCISKKNVHEIQFEYSKVKMELSKKKEELNSTRNENSVLKAQLMNMNTLTVSPKQVVQLSEDVKTNTIKLNDLPSNFVPDNKDGFDLDVLKNRKYSNNPIIEGYRNNIKELIGSVIELNEQNEIVDVGEFNFISDTKKIKLDAPKSGKFIEKTYNETNNKEAGWLFFKYTVKEKEIIRFSIEDISTAQLSKGAFDYKSLHKAYKFTDENIDNLYVIRTINVSEILSRKYKEESKNLKISEIPIGGTVFKASNDYYVSNTDLKRDYIVGLGYSKLKTILKQSAHLIEE